MKKIGKKRRHLFKKYEYKNNNIPWIGEKFNFHDILNTLLYVEKKKKRKEEGRDKVVEEEERGRKRQCGIKKGKGKSEGRK